MLTDIVIVFVFIIIVALLFPMITEEIGKGCKEQLNISLVENPFLCSASGEPSLLFLFLFLLLPGALIVWKYTKRVFRGLGSFDIIKNYDDDKEDDKDDEEEFGTCHRCGVTAMDFYDDKPVCESCFDILGEEITDEESKGMLREMEDNKDNELEKPEETKEERVSNWTKRREKVKPDHKEQEISKEETREDRVIVKEW